MTTATSEICVFCHTPHGAAAETLALGGPLWNRHLSTQSYTLYDNSWSFSFEAAINPGAPTGFSRLCLSCHDGTIALGSVVNAPGSGQYLVDIPMVGSPELGPGETMPLGPGGELTGDTRRLGTNLRNDHPISFRFDSALLIQDPELVDPGPAPARPDQEPNFPAGIGPLRRYAGDNPAVFDSIQCTSCHNPHAITWPRFLRAPIVDCSNNDCPETGLSVNSQGQQLICLFCHNKDRPAGNSYTTSTHAVSTAIHEEYPSSTDYPANPGYDFDGVHTIGQASCRNCHDPHTVQGANRLHREGVDAPGGADTIENTCYLCHSPGPTQPQPFGIVDPPLPAGDNTGFVVTGDRIAPDIWSQFAKDRNLGVNSPCDQTPLGAPAKPIASAQTDCGSAMNLRLDDLSTPRNHQPFFVKQPQEGVEYASASPPATENEFEPGLSTPDTISTRHIECVDCHNPHQVTVPSTHPAGRMKGMKGITQNDRVVGVGVIDPLCDPPSCNREPYINEVCFRCHGNSVPDLFAGDDNPGSTIFRSNPQPGAQASIQDLSYQGFSNKRLEFSAYATAAAEISSPAVDASYEGDADRPVWNAGPPIRRVGPGIHQSYHPVVRPGRNATVQLFNQLKEAFGLTAQAELTSLTIQCTDCHNNDHYDRFTNPGVFGPSPIGGLLSGPLTESTGGRTTDRLPDFQNDYNSAAPGGRVAEPIGPHGSSYIRILRARYNTDIANTARNFRTDGFSASHADNFLLCFQCHDRAAFDAYWPGADARDENLTNFFGNPSLGGSGLDNLLNTSTQPGTTPWDLNLHMYHLVRTGAYCHECHYNVHSNAQARNTIYGDGTDCVIGTSNPNCDETVAGTFTGLPRDGEDGILDGISDTHLINFSPGGPTAHSGHREVTVGGDIPCVTTAVGAEFGVSVNTACTDNFADAGIEGVTAPYPVWYYDMSSGGSNTVVEAFRCNLRCHGVVMATCFYKAAGGDVVSPSSFWCAGGEDQRPLSSADDPDGL